MTTDELRTIAANLPLHDPARAALEAAANQITGLEQALAYANSTLMATQTDRANLLCAYARIAYGVGNADDYSATAKAAIAGLCDRAEESVDTANQID